MAIMTERTKDLLRSVVVGIPLGALGSVITHDYGTGVVTGIEWIAGNLLAFESDKDLKRLQEDLKGGNKIRSLYHSLKAAGEATIGYGIMGAVPGGLTGGPDNAVIAGAVAAIFGLVSSSRTVITEYSRHRWGIEAVTTA